MDDMLAGADTIADVELIITEVTQLLQLRLFELSKWTLNCSQLLINGGYQQSSTSFIAVHIRAS